jgi:hypothetical protein
VADLVDGITRIVHGLGDGDLPLLKRFHTLLAKRTKAKGEAGSGKLKGKAKPCGTK